MRRTLRAWPPAVALLMVALAGAAALGAALPAAGWNSTSALSNGTAAGAALPGTNATRFNFEFPIKGAMPGWGSPGRPKMNAVRDKCSGPHGHNSAWLTGAPAAPVPAARAGLHAGRAPLAKPPCGNAPRRRLCQPRRAGA
jgi:hypothetical protein